LFQNLQLKQHAFNKLISFSSSTNRSWRDIFKMAKINTEFIYGIFLIELSKIVTFCSNMSQTEGNIKIQKLQLLQWNIWGAGCLYPQAIHFFVKCAKLKVLYSLEIETDSTKLDNFAKFRKASPLMTEFLCYQSTFHNATLTTNWAIKNNSLSFKIFNLSWLMHSTSDCENQTVLVTITGQ